MYPSHKQPPDSTAPAAILVQASCKMIHVVLREAPVFDFDAVEIRTSLLFLLLLRDVNICILLRGISGLVHVVHLHLSDRLCRFAVDGFQCSDDGDGRLAAARILKVLLKKGDGIHISADARRRLNLSTAIGDHLISRQGE